MDNNRVLHVDDHHYKVILSVVYIRAIEKLLYRLKSTSTRRLCLWSIIDFYTLMTTTTKVILSVVYNRANEE